MTSKSNNLMKYAGAAMAETQIARTTAVILYFVIFHAHLSGKS